MPNPHSPVGFRRTVATLLAGFLLAASIAAPATARPISPHVYRAMKLLYTMKLTDGSTARVYSNGIVIAYKYDKKSGKTTQSELRFPVGPNDGRPLSAQLAFPTRRQIQTAFALKRPSFAQPYATGRIVVVFRDGVTAPTDRFTLDAAHVRALRSKVRGIAPQYTNDARLNETFASLGVYRMTRLFGTYSRGSLRAMSERAQSVTGRPTLDIGNAFEVDLANSTIVNALAKLSDSNSVAYAAPDYFVKPLDTGFVELDRHNPNFTTKPVNDDLSERGLLPMSSRSSVPKNYAVSASQQSMLNATGVNAVAAYDEVERTLHQLPGTGVRITNVSIGDIIDASDATGPCANYESGNGPTTVVSGGQRYLELPGMANIPVYTADAAGDLGQGSVCGTGDGALDEIGMDFSVMAPLPDGQQPPSRSVSGFGDLLGIAPGASYRLVVPGAAAATLSDIDGALIGAAEQKPKPDVITASLGIGVDSIGFPGRYLGDDPLTASVLAAIAIQDDIVLCVSANDGTRALDGLGNVAIGTSGGAAPTDLATNGSGTTTINDIAHSSFPSHDLDDGNIVAGATTLDDIFSAQPQNPAEGALGEQQTFPAVRWNGMTVFASGFGSLVSLSAPGDNIVTYEHEIGGGPTSAVVGLNGGTSASAPEIAAGAAVAIQVARAIGKPFANAQAVRSFLIKTGTAVPQVPQSDTNNVVGPQLDVANAVEQLLASGHKAIEPGVARVAIAQRRDAGVLDAFFTTDTNRSAIDLAGPISSTTNEPTGENQYALITIAPDWEAMPANTRYSLFVTGHPKQVLSTAPHARLSAEAILAADGLQLASTMSRKVPLTYRARYGNKIVQSAFTLTFGPSTGKANALPAPIVAPVTKGSSIAVKYDLTNVVGVSNPTLVVSEPGRINTVTGQEFHPAFTMALSKTKGTVQVPVDQLQGAGIYGIGVEFNNPGPPNGIWVGQYSDWAYTRIDDGSTQKPASLLVGPAGSTSQLGHYAELPLGANYKISWNASNVKGATGAILEVSTSGPSIFGIQNSFNNPNGSERDDNGVDTGSVYYAPLPSVRGMGTFKPKTLGLVPTGYEQLRVLATKGGTVVGEASDVITVREDGIVPPDGGFIPYTNFGINLTGNDGYVADNANLTGTGEVISSVNSFNLTTNTITNTIASSVGRQFYQLTTGAVYANDIGAYSDNLCDPSVPLTTTFCAGTLNPNNYIVNPISGGVPGAVWTMPSLFGGFEPTGALNGISDEALLEGVQEVNGPPDVTLVLSNVSANTIDNTFDVNGPLGPPGAVAVGDVAENPNVGSAVLSYVDFANPNGGNCEGLCAQLATFSLTNGTLQGILNVPGYGFPDAMAVDTGNNEAIVAPEFSSEATVYNLTTMQQIATVTLGQSYYPGFTPDGQERAAADPTNHLFIVDQDLPPNVALDDNNPNELFYVIDANGNIVKQFTLPATVAAGSFPGNLMQLNPALREGYVVSADVTQLLPFNY